MAGKRRTVSGSSVSSDDTVSASDTPANDLVLTKYSMAADICNSALKEVLAAIKDGASVGELCDLGDRVITERTAKVFKKDKDALKGISMPTCVSVNNCICHFSPLRSDKPVIIKDGDLVKIDLGAHIDGFIATAAHSVVVGASTENKVKGRQAKVILAAYNAMEAAIRMLRPGQYKNMEITDVIDKVAKAYDVKPVENMLSHELKKNKIDGEKQIIQNPGEKQRSEMTKCGFEKYEVYAIDILMSTGEGKTRMLDTRTTVYKKVDDLVYSLKVKASRAFLSSAVNKYGLMPFTLRSFEDEKQAKLGVLECERRNLMRPYQVLYERDGEFVAQFKSTVLIMPNGLLKITGIPIDWRNFENKVKIQDQMIVSLLNTSLKPKKPKEKNKDENNEKVEDSDAAKKNNAVLAKEKVSVAKKEKNTAVDKENAPAAKKEKNASVDKEKVPIAKKEKSATVDKEKAPTAKKEKNAASEKEKVPSAKKEKSVAAEKEKNVEKDKNPPAKKEKSAAVDKEKAAAAKKEKSVAAEKEKGQVMKKEGNAAVAKEKAPVAKKEKIPVVEKEKSAAAAKEKVPVAKKEKSVAMEKEKVPGVMKEKVAVVEKEKNVEGEKEKAPKVNTKTPKNNKKKAATNAPNTGVGVEIMGKK